MCVIARKYQCFHHPSFMLELFNKSSTFILSLIALFYFFSKILRFF